MRLYVGITDHDWYAQLSARPDLDEVNFWAPGRRTFKVLKPGELFLFKLKARFGHVIVGGAIFAIDTLLPLSLAWQTFGEKNGVRSLADMGARIRKYLSPEARAERDPVIGCRLLQQPFFLPSDQWFRVPDTFPENAVSGKSYDLSEPEGAFLYRSIEERLSWAEPFRLTNPAPGFGDPPRTGTPQLVVPRLGQGSFRVAVMNGFGRRCAVTGEKTLPILDAAHIRPWAEGGENRPGNGILLRTDVHRLFDLGYVTVGHDNRFQVSPRLREDYDNGKEYYDLHGQPIRNPGDPVFLPAPDALEWHHNNRFARPGASTEIIV